MCMNSTLLVKTEPRGILTSGDVARATTGGDLQKARYWLQRLRIRPIGRVGIFHVYSESAVALVRDGIAQHGRLRRAKQKMEPVMAGAGEM